MRAQSGWVFCNRLPDQSHSGGMSVIAQLSAFRFDQCRIFKTLQLVQKTVPTPTPWP